MASPEGVAGLKNSPCLEATGSADGPEAIDAIAAQSRVELSAPRKVAARGFIGHDLAHKAPEALRVVAFQGQSRLASGDADSAARRFGRYLASLDADLVLVSETGIRDGTSRLRQFKSRLRSDYGWVLYNNYPAHLPYGKGAMLLSRVEYPARPKSITRDSQARGIAASFAYPIVGKAAAADTRQTVVMRAVAGYGVTGWTLRVAAPDEHDKFKE